MHSQHNTKGSSRVQGTLSRTPRFSLALACSLALLPLSGPALAQDTNDDEDVDRVLEEVVVTGTQIRGASINEALSVSVISSDDIEALGISSGDELLDVIPEQGQNFFNEAENIAGGVNAARGDIGAFNLRNIGTGNTLVLMNGRRVVNAASYQTEEVGGSFVPVATANSAAIPVFGLDRLEVLRDGASAIYGADAVAGVVNTVMRDDYEGLTVSGRWQTYDNIPRDDYTATVEWGGSFNSGRTYAGLFATFYHRDRVNSQDDEKWADSDYRRLIPEGSPWEGDTAFRNDSANSLWGQFDIVGDRYNLNDLDITDSAGEFETYPIGDPRCEGGFQINEFTCGHADGQGTYRYNLNENRDVASELDRINLYTYLNHEFDNGIESYTELGWYQAKSNLYRHPAASFTAVKLRVGPENYYNPFGPCGSPNRLPDSIIGTEVPCEGLQLEIDNYRFAELPRIVDVENETYRLLQGFRGSFGNNWDWDSAVLYSKASRDDVTHNRVSNQLMQDALEDPTEAAYNPFVGGMGSNIERALVDVYRNSESDLALADFKLTNPSIFNTWAGGVGFLAGAEYRRESFKDDRDPRLDGTIQFTDWQNDTYPFISDIVNSSPTPDNEGDRNVASLFTEFIVPLHETLDVQLALRYENFSDVGSTTVPKVAFGWTPTEWLMFRGSWSEAFRAPNLITINETLVVRNNTNTDWACEYAAEYGGDPDQDILDCSYNMQRRAQGSQELEPEKSDNSSLGIVLTPTENLTLTVDFWKIKKEDTIGLFGEENHTMLDLLYRLQAGTGSCASVGNPALGRIDPDDDQIAIYTAAGICPAGDVEFVDDNYQNLDVRKVEGYDFGVYYDLDTNYGDWSFRWQGSIYTRYDQEPGGAAQVLLDAQEDGTLPSNYPVTGFSDLLRMDGNQEKKMNARARWRLDEWGATVAWYYLDDFYQSSLTLEDGSQWVIPSYDYFNLSADYTFDAFDITTRIRLAVNNVTDERAPLADRYFGYFSDAHSDYGRSYYIDFRVDF
ncbi:TonB-dependent receptor plug domain-containing protein [Marinihelvus fidelis]|uniref:TonB-dependent receptor plug domain-containing protein n=1 Tax=Marinihelvus fidelis TaxID=2613842 RepID=A0A5N0T7Q3_9GAMM|nr:TonB-dependent receptor [Marinihelvus fidelis]KAA9130177.1 TonB-dependent receptor plug domain-containing protein [Marinihelvus fidelis]